MKSNFLFLFTVLVSLIFVSCDKDSPFKDYSDPYPKIETLDAIAGEGDTIILTANCTSEGKFPLDFVGFYYDTDSIPKMNRQEVFEPVLGKFGCKIGGLSSDSTYYFVPFAVNNLGYSKGAVKSFKVGKPLPQIAPCGLNENSAILNGSNVSLSYPTSSISFSNAIITAESYTSGIAITLKFNGTKLTSGKYTTSTESTLALGAKNVLVSVRNSYDYTENPIVAGGTVYVSDNGNGTVTVSFCDLNYKSNNSSKTISSKITCYTPK